mmetsp:Transcript_18603/g.38899  ORF Transcript_18603/g.38899 Transcript_18603/m.38899 type:complete len:222 (+) Transcript_18603:1910-2575(+)
MARLSASAHGCDNFVSVSWVRRGSISRNTTAGNILRAHALLLCHFQISDTLGFLPGLWNSMVDAASRLWNYTDNELLPYYKFHYPQVTSWQLSHLPPRTKLALTTLLCGGQCNMASLLPVAEPTTPTGLFGPPSAPTSAYPLTYLSSTTQFPSCKFSPTASVQESWPQRAAELRNAQSSNISAPFGQGGQNRLSPTTPTLRLRKRRPYAHLRPTSPTASPP